MKIQRYIDKAIAFINGPISREMEFELTSSYEDFATISEHELLKLKNDIYLFVEKTWAYVKESNSIILEAICIGYGNYIDGEYVAIDETTSLSIYTINVADEIEYMIGCAFPNTKIER